MQKLWSNTEPVTGSRFLVAVWPGALALLNLLAGKLWRSCGDCALTKKSGACAQQGGLGSSQHGNELLWDTEGQVGGEAKARHRGSLEVGLSPPRPTQRVPPQRFAKATKHANQWRWLPSSSIYPDAWRAWSLDLSTAPGRS